MTQPNWSFVAAAAIAVFALLEVASHTLRAKRGSVWRVEAAIWAAALVAVGSVYLMARLAAPVMVSMPSDSQAVAASRASLVIFLFWLFAFAVLGLTGISAFSASFAVLGWVDRPPPHPVVPVPSPFAEEFWGIVAAREHLSRKERVMIWLRHALFGVALVLTSGVGMLMTFGLPKQALWPYLAVGIVVAFVLNPARSDRRMAAHRSLEKPAEEGNSM